MRFHAADQTASTRCARVLLVVWLLLQAFQIPAHAIPMPAPDPTGAAPVECPMHQDQAEQAGDESCVCRSGCCIAGIERHAHVGQRIILPDFEGPEPGPRAWFKQTESRLLLRAYETRAPPKPLFF